MQISFDRLFAKKIAFVLFNSLCQSFSKKLNFIKIWQLEVGQNKDLVCYRKKQSFRRVVLVSIKGLWVWRKSQKISTASDQYFLSYVKKKTGGGSNWPPASRNKVWTFSRLQSKSLKNTKYVYLNISFSLVSWILISEVCWMFWMELAEGLMINIFCAVKVYLNKRKWV